MKPLLEVTNNEAKLHAKDEELARVREKEEQISAELSTVNERLKQAEERERVLRDDLVRISLTPTR